MLRLIQLTLVLAVFGPVGDACAKDWGRKGGTVRHASAKQATQQPGMAEFIKIRAPRSGQLAPDGSFYYIDRPEGTYQLYRSTDGQAKKLTEFEDGISGYDLSEDGRWILVQAAVGGDEQFDIYLIDTKSDEMKTLMESREIRYDSPLWRRDSKAFAYRANVDSPSDFHIYVYELDGGASTKVVEREGFYYPGDFNSDGSKLVVGKYMSASHSELYEVDLTGEAAAKDRTIRRITPDEQKSFSPVGYAKGDQAFLTQSNHGGDRIRLHSINLENGSISPLLTELGEWDVDLASMNADRTVLAVGINKDGYRPLHLYKPPDMKQQRVVTMGDDGIVANVDFSNGQMLFSNISARSPGVIYRASMDDVWSGSFSKATPMTVVDDQGIELRNFQLPELVKVRSFDGLEIPAFLYLPPGHRKGERIRFLVTFHGGPESQFRPGFRAEIPYFLSRGFGVLAPNVRGSSGYGTEYLEADNYKNRMKSVDDGVACAKWLVKHGYSKEKSIGVYGGSYGGFMVVATATRAPGLFGAACDIVGIVNFQTFLERTKPYRRKLREAEYGPLTDPDFLKSISPLYLVDKMDTPMLIAHGKNDPRVPIDEATQLYEALKSRDKVVELLVFDDEGHGFRKDENRIEFYEKMADFFEQQLKKPSNAPSAGLME